MVSIIIDIPHWLPIKLIEIEEEKKIQNTHEQKNADMILKNNSNVKMNWTPKKSSGLFEKEFSENKQIFLTNYEYWNNTIGGYNSTLTP